MESTTAIHHNYINDVEELHDDHNESTSTATLHPDHKNDIERDDPGLEPNNIVTSKFLFIYVLYLLKY